MRRYGNDGLTVRERDIYIYIVRFIGQKGYSPTINEIACGVITSRSFVRNVLYKLEDKGFLTFDKHKRRTIVLTNKDIAI